MKLISTFISLSSTVILLFLSYGAAQGQPQGANKNSTTPLSSVMKIAGALPQDQIANGLKEALALGIQQAAGKLGKSDGFLNDPQVKIPLPESIKKIESALRLMGQGKIADQFTTAMNRAAEQAVPETIAVLGEAVKKMTLTDAQSILSGSNNAATDYFRRTSDAALQSRILPIVQSATAKAGVTQSYKLLTDKLGSGLVNKKLLDQQALDIDSYITRKALDGLYLKISEQEKLIRENPTARTTDLLQKVFGSVKK